MSSDFVVIFIWGLVGSLSLVGAGLGWWYGTVSFYGRSIGEANIPVEMRRSRHVRWHLARVFWALVGAAGGSLVAVMLLMGLAR